MISCKQCGNPCGVGAELCRRCEQLNKDYPLAPGARRWVSDGDGMPQNLPRTVGMRPELAAPYGGTIVENLVQTAIADTCAVEECDGAVGLRLDDGPLSDTFTGDGGDFGGGGASGDF